MGNETATNFTTEDRFKNIDPGEISLKAKFFTFKTLISFALGFLILYFLYRQVNLKNTLNIVKQCRLG